MKSFWNLPTASTTIIFWIIERKLIVLISSLVYLYIDRKKFDKSWNICKLTFTLSNVQAVVERGFSVNKEIVENLKQKSLIIQRMVHDYVTVKYASSHHEYNIPSSVILKCKSPHARYV